MGLGSKFRHYTHKIAHEAGRIGSQLTGSDKVGSLVEKAVKYTPFMDPVGHAYQAAHVAGHIAAPSKPASQAEEPEKESFDYGEYLEAMNGYMAMMGEYMDAMADSMNKVEPAAEPLKQAQTEMSAAKADTDRKQLLRRGLMSTYTRYGQTGGTQRLGA